MEFWKCSVFGFEFLIASKFAIKIFENLEIHKIQGSKDYVLGLADLNNKYTPVLNLEDFLADVFHDVNFLKTQASEKIAQENLKFLHIQNYCEELIFQVFVSPDKINLEIPEKPPTEICPSNKPEKIDNNKSQGEDQKTLKSDSQSININEKETNADANSESENQTNVITVLPFFVKHSNFHILDISTFFNYLDNV